MSLYSRKRSLYTLYYKKKAQKKALDQLYGMALFSLTGDRFLIFCILKIIQRALSNRFSRSAVLDLSRKFQKSAIPTHSRTFSYFFYFEDDKKSTIKSFENQYYTRFMSKISKERYTHT